MGELEGDVGVGPLTGEKRDCHPRGLEVDEMQGEGPTGHFSPHERRVDEEVLLPRPYACHLHLLPTVMVEARHVPIRSSGLCLALAASQVLQIDVGDQVLSACNELLLAAEIPQIEHGALGDLGDGAGRAGHIVRTTEDLGDEIVDIHA